ncbi:hypothetical protein [Serratia sp. 1D1416]|uniref:hypothetical protein n=1 Tax=Serratia sp. 1D1416 TaxID=2447890 RepID=UPI001013C6D9|nr:hypothetical protein [Serratia sp. 1D1416]
MTNKIDLYRTRIALAYIDFCRRHYGGKWADVIVGQKKKKAVRVDISQQSIEMLMKEFIETMLRAEFGKENGEQSITSSYDAMLSHTGKLTPLGVTALGDMMIDAVAYKLQNPNSQLLQVVAQ